MAKRPLFVLLLGLFLIGPATAQRRCVGCAKTVDVSELSERDGVVTHLGQAFTGISVQEFGDSPPAGSSAAKEETTYKAGIKDGPTQQFYADGQLYIRGNYRNGVEDGLWETFHENGQLALKWPYVNGLANGLHESLYPDGQIFVRVNFKDNLEEGVGEMWYENGQLWERKNYVAGEVVGPVEKWYENGQPVAVEQRAVSQAPASVTNNDVSGMPATQIVSDAAALAGPKVDYMKDITEGYFYMVNGQRFTGTLVTKFYDIDRQQEDGTLEYRVVHGVREEPGVRVPKGQTAAASSAVRVDESQAKLEVYTMYNGREFTGIAVRPSGDSDGNESSTEEKYVGGKRMGWVSWYTKNGQMADRLVMANPDQSRLWEQWYLTGQLKQRTTYRTSQEDFLEENWYVSGQLQKRVDARANENRIEECWDEKGVMMICPKRVSDY